MRETLSESSPEAVGDSEIHAVYRHFNSKNELIYVGVSLCAVARLAQHRSSSHWFKDIATVKIEYANSRQEALLAERKIIEKERPLYNVTHNRWKRKESLAKPEAECEEHKAKLRLLHHVVHFDPIYTRYEVAAALKISTDAVGRLWDAGELGCFQFGRRTMCTGWQLIDYIETLTQD